jgi:Delta3,5-Delta2,4-dienoyl-CoA isomerase
MTVITINPPPRYFNVSSPAEYVAQVEINRPEKLNAFAPPMWNELRHIFAQISPNPDIRVVIITGAGDKAFTAGKSNESYRV